MHLAESPLWFWVYAPIRHVLLCRNGFPSRLSRARFQAGTASILPLSHPNTGKMRVKKTFEFPTLVIAQDCAPNEAVTIAFKAAGLESHATETMLNNFRSMQLYLAYKNKRVSPVDVCERIIEVVSKNENDFPLFVVFKPDLIRQHAEASEKRWQAGKPLSPIDGIPFAVKDEVDVEPFPTSIGTSFMANKRPTKGTFPGAAALQAAGAVCLGKTVMQEIGLGTTGLNTHQGTARNPHNVEYFTGGSSSGSAALVASGLAPFAHGSDGGGSLRIPGALCGVVALKPTHGRVCAEPKPPIAPTVGVHGVLGATVRDCMLAYALLGNRGHFQHSEELPSPLLLPDLVAILRCSKTDALKGIRLGLPSRWFDHADRVVTEACHHAVGYLRDAGAEVIEVQIPFVNDMAAAHSCTISREIAEYMHPFLMEDASLRNKLNLETRISLATSAGFTHDQYEVAQMVRRQGDDAIRRVFQKCDVIVTPTVPQMAPKINPNVLKTGCSDLSLTTRLMRFAFVANFLGFPSLTVPVGMEPLPIGLQLMSRHWEEDILFWVSAVLEDRARDTPMSEGSRPAQRFWDIASMMAHK